MREPSSMLMVPLVSRRPPPAAGSVAHSGDLIDGDAGQHTLRINLRALPPRVECLYLVMSAYAGARLNEVEQPFVW